MERLPLPAWKATDLVDALAPGPVALLDGLTWGDHRCTLVAWAPAVTALTLADAQAAAGSVPLPPDAPSLLGAAVGSLTWDGEDRFWVPAQAALFDPAGGALWVRGGLPPMRPVEHGHQPVADAPSPARPLWTREAYCAAVREAQANMATGQISKLILSVPFEARTERRPLEVYARLADGDPPGLRFLLDHGPGRGALLGISPEPLVTLFGRRAEMHLLAGTRPAGAVHERELMTSAKDREEHAVAVEQARQDLLTVCVPSSVAVDRFMTPEQHPGLVHLASHLSGLLRPDATGPDLVAACFPAGTVGGIPRSEAIGLIGRLEPAPRDWYAGAVGALLPDGDLQLWLTIRSLFLKDGTATVRAGAGLVAASQPEQEWQECLNKARRALLAVGAEVSPHE